MPGFDASMIDQNSIRPFSTGVPDMAMKPSVLSSRTCLKAAVL